MIKLWVNFIAKQYKKYYPDNIEELMCKMSTKVFKSKTEAFNFMRENATGGLKRMLDTINIEKGR